MPDSGVALTTAELRALFERHEREIRDVISWVAHRWCLRGEEAEDFQSWVYLRLLENDYRVLAAFRGRSSFKTYLTSVIQNLARDYRVRSWGRWRPTAAAERLGVAAVQLETLMHRDGFTFEEAAEALRANHGVKSSVAELADLAAQLPARVQLRIEATDGVEAAPGPERTDRALTRAERRDTVERTARALNECMAELDARDRLVLKMYYASGLKISMIAAALEARQRRLYTRRDRGLRQLKGCLGKSGIEGQEVLEALARWDGELEVDYGVDAPGREEPVRREPSKRVESHGGQRA